jgi:hypothetical protein
LLHNLRHGKYFGDGRIAYIMRVIEYQHRGMPHCHIVFQLTNAPPRDDKIACGLFIDKYVIPIISFCFIQFVKIDGSTLRGLSSPQHQHQKKSSILTWLWILKFTNVIQRNKVRKGVSTTTEIAFAVTRTGIFIPPLVLTKKGSLFTSDLRKRIFSSRRTIAACCLIGVPI